MNKIATIERFINEIQSIHKSFTVDRLNSIANVTDEDDMFNCYLPDKYKAMYDQWKRSLYKYLYKYDMDFYRAIRPSIMALDELLAKRDLSKLILNVHDSFSNITLHLEDIKSIYQEYSSNKVFIVHGHDELLISQTEALLRKLELEPIILRDQPSIGKSIQEKFEEYTDVAFAIILYTSCDKGCENQKNAKLKPRARQNVVFEHGYLYSELGRKRVCALVEEGIEIPSDLAGVVYISIDPYGAWKNTLSNELEAAGFDIDKNKL